MITRKGISVIIPAYNEEENIERAITAAEKFFSSFFINNYEIIVVNDGSKDKTGKTAEDLKSPLKNLKVFHHPKNLGMGAAVRTGVSNAKYELIFVTCGDLQFDINEFEKFLPFLASDIVIGYRLNRQYSFFRKINTFIYRSLIRLIFGLKVKDPSWVKLFKKEIFDNLLLKSKGFFWDVEFLIKAKSKGYQIEQVPVHSYERRAGRASGKNLFKIFETFISLVKTWWSIRFTAKKKIGLAFSLLVIGTTIIFWLPTIDTPFWWDSAGFIVHAARYYVDSNFKSFFLPSDATISAMAHPPLFPFLLAATWKIFGDSLLVSHLFYLPFIILAAFFTYLLGREIAGFKKEIINNFIGFSAVLLLFFSPVFLAQTGIIYVEIPAAAFALMSVYFFLKKRWGWYLLSGALLVFMKEVAAVIILAISIVGFFEFLFELFKRGERKLKKKIKEVFFCFLPFLFLAGWFILHRLLTGWMFAIPSYQKDFAENVFTFSFKKILMVFHFFFFFQGRIFASLAVLISIIAILFKKKAKESLLRKSLGLLFLIVVFVPFLFGKIEFLPRYIIFGLPFLFLIFSYILAALFQQKAILAEILALLILLPIFSSHWDNHYQLKNWHFPPIEENLEYLDIIDVGRETVNFIEKNYPDATVYTAFPTSYMLAEPFQHYVSKPINVKICNEYKEGDKIDLVILHVLSPPEMSCLLIIRNLNLPTLKTFERNGKWMEIYKKE